MEIHETWVEGGVKVKLINSWSEDETEVAVHHDSTKMRMLFLIRVSTLSIQGVQREPYAHAVLVTDDDAQASFQARGVKKKTSRTHMTISSLAKGKLS